MEEEPRYDAKPLLIDLYGDVPLASGQTPASEIERLLTSIERLANGPQYYDRMIILRSQLKDLRKAWNTLQAERGL